MPANRAVTPTSLQRTSLNFSSSSAWAMVVALGIVVIIEDKTGWMPGERSDRTRCRVDGVIVG